MKHQRSFPARTFGEEKEKKFTGRTLEQALSSLHQYYQGRNNYVFSTSLEKPHTKYQKYTITTKPTHSNLHESCGKSKPIFSSKQQEVKNIYLEQIDYHSFVFLYELKKPLAEIEDYLCLPAERVSRYEEIYRGRQK